MPEKAINPKNATGFLLILIPAALAMSALFVAWPLILGLTILIAGGNVWQGYEWSKTARSIDPVFQQLIIQNRGEITPLDLSLNAKVSGAVSNRYLAAKASEFGTGSRQHPDGGQIYYFVSISTLGRIFDDSDEAPMPTIMPATSPVVAFSPAFIPAQSQVEVLQPQLDPLANAASIPVVAPIPPLEPTPAATQLESPPAPLAVESPLSQNLDEQATPSIDLASSEADEPPTVAAPSLVPTESKLVTIIQSELAKRLDVHASTVYKRRSEPNFTDWTRNRDPEGLAWGYLEATKEYYRIDS